MKDSLLPGHTHTAAAQAAAPRRAGRLSGTRLQGPEFAALARSFGAHGERMACSEDFPSAFARARECGGLALLELCVDPRQITPTMRLAD